MQKGKILDYWKSYARDVCPSIFLGQESSEAARNY